MNEIPDNRAIPHGMTNANWFGLFNAVSFQIFLGPPLVLYAKSLGASATLLGVLASLTPLLTIFQIPAAHYIERFGYRRFVLAGWGTRNVCVFLCTVIPVLPLLGNAWKLGLLLGLQFLFNLLRGIASGAWFPWITELLPEQIRAKFLSRDMRFGQFGSLLALLTSACILRQESAPWRFTVLFFISAVGGAVSLFFLNRVPDVIAPEKLKRSGTPVPWRAIISYPPFARLILFNVLFVFTGGSLGVFTIVFLKGTMGFGENQILFFLCGSFVAGIVCLDTAGRMLDRLGSKGLLRAAIALHLLFVIGWVLVAGRIIAPAVAIIATIYIVAGVAGAAINIANSRLAMNTIPEMGRSHFYALFSVITSLVLGVSPILWGLFLDGMAAVNRQGGTIHWNRYSIYFTLILALNIAVWFAVSLLKEQKHPQMYKS